MQGKAAAEGGEEDQAERQRQDRPQQPAIFALRRLPGIGEEQRRDEEQEKEPGSIAVWKPAVGQARAAPSAIWTIGSGTILSSRVSGCDATTAMTRIRMKVKVCIPALPARFALGRRELYPTAIRQANLAGCG